MRCAYHMERLSLEVMLISLKAEQQKGFQESSYLEQAIRTLISNGAGSDSYTGAQPYFFLLVKAPSSFNLPLHFLPKRDFRYSKKAENSRTKGLLNLPNSDVEYDCRVVEYVGEIVGLGVADKRENKYQFGRKLQYKSARYTFRIDKEHIIDATHKGGIARFVNHSCLPNCVAKVISMRSEKKQGSMRRALISDMCFPIRVLSSIFSSSVRNSVVLIGSCTMASESAKPHQNPSSILVIVLNITDNSRVVVSGRTEVTTIILLILFFVPPYSLSFL
ncbi:hypothetical protein HYC85_022604 [Camellia sinensis]|uniref:SET domain-containing protein n=1 Tax=Camellia sinensis TaxID=4442 RepID=A0A7J7GDF6_CAMSI|nr:hypothetical protein HYC85_022604 [Camellia sinensis]